MFERLSNLTRELQNTNSINEKKEILTKYNGLKKILNYVYDPYKKYGVTSKQIKKRNDLINKDLYFEEFEIYSLLDDLYKRQLTGYDAIKAIRGFIYYNNKYEDLIYAILDKDLKTRTGTSIINKVYPNLIPEFKIALAKKYEDNIKRVDFKKDNWYASRKLDGVRVITRIENGKITFYSRAGNEFTTLEVVRSELKRLKVSDGVIDGELCITDENGNEDFTSVVSQIKRKDETIKTPKYKIFDHLTLKEFDSGKSARKLSHRLVYDRLPVHGSSFIDYVSMHSIKNLNHLNELITEANDNKWEGLMIRKNVGYVGKRTNDLLKIKKFHDDEYIVKNVEIGPFRLINKETGLETTEQILTNVIIEHKGHNVSVGSGFSVNERRMFANNPALIIGKEITVQYFEESTNRDGGISLRFPTVKKVWLEKNRNI